MSGARRRRRRPAPWLGIASTLLLTLARLSYCHNTVAIDTRDTLVPPISFPPAQNWEGIDGSWNTFSLLVGTPPQTVRVEISTASQQTWVVAPRGCEGIDLENCPENRGRIFESNESSTWEERGRFKLGLVTNLGYDGDADYGFDVVTLGGQGENGPTMEGTTVGTFGAEDFWFGHFGVNPKPTNFSSMNEPSPSYMSLLKDAGLIPSLSFGYTAGAQYRFRKVLASLTLGGYDSSRFVPNNVTFTFAPDNERDLVVAIQTVTSSTDAGPIAQLLPDPIYAYVDSTVPQIWLPVEACRAFEEAFGLTYDNETDLYLLDQDAHEELLDLNPNVTFTLARGLAGGANVDIVLPYAAFDMQATPPYQGLAEQSYYFPLRRAANETQYTLGRVFLQESYLFVNWERQTFNVSQCAWEEGMQENIVAVPPGNGTATDNEQSSGGDTSGSGGIGSGAIIGIAVAAVAVIVIGIVTAVFVIRRRKNARKVPGQGKHKPSDGAVAGDPPDSQPRENARRSNEEGGYVFPKVELDADQHPHELCGDESSSHKGPPSLSEPAVAVGSTLLSSDSDGRSPGGFAEADGHPREVFEMPGDMPARQEAGGRQLSEKETMMVREARYNGFDPNSPTSPASSQPPSVPNESGTDTYNSNGTGDSAPSPLTPIRGPPPRRPRRQVTAGEIIELSPFERDNLVTGQGLVSPVRGPGGSEGAGTDDGPGTSPFSPVEEGSGSHSGSGAGVSPIGGRRRFSYE